MKVFDVMTWGAISVRGDESILRAAQLMLEYKISGLPVIDTARHLIGVVTQADILGRSSAADLANGRSVEEIMTPRPYSINGDAPLKDILELMENHGIKRLPVVDDEHVVGIVGRANILQALVDFARETEASLRRDFACQKRSQLRPGFAAEPNENQARVAVAADC